MNICVIPARGGSKRIPRKNIKLFHGKPMIAWSIQAAIEAECFDRIIVSTDDDEIATVSEQYGAEIPFMRPAELADDFATTVDVMKHSVQALQNNSDKALTLCCLYATAPFTTATDLRQAYDLFIEEPVDYVFSAASFAFPVQRAIRMNPDNRVSMLIPEHRLTRSQDLEPMYHDAGQFYWGSDKAFEEARPFFSERSKAFILPRYRVQDIDDREDWERAELMMRVLQS